LESITESYTRDGFAFVPGLFTLSETQAAKDEVQRLLTTRKDHAGVFVGLAAASAHFAALARHPQLLDAIEACLGPEIEFLSDKIVFKSASAGFGSPWHQDWPYWKGTHKLSVWIALDPATPANGCLKLLPGSHRSHFIHDGVAGPGEGFGNRLSEGAIDESLALTLPCMPGDAVLFHDLMLHASHPNATGEDRYALISTYRAAAEPDLTYDLAVAAAVVRTLQR
jgi:phytanoyl-CoA hydroxylase